eukprot:ctg_3030.g383
MTRTISSASTIRVASNARRERASAECGDGVSVCVRAGGSGVQRSIPSGGACMRPRWRRGVSVVDKTTSADAREKRRRRLRPPRRTRRRTPIRYGFYSASDGAVAARRAGVSGPPARRNKADGIACRSAPYSNVVPAVAAPAAVSPRPYPR